MEGGSLYDSRTFLLVIFLNSGLVCIVPETRRESCVVYLFIRSTYGHRKEGRKEGRKKEWKMWMVR